MQCGDEKRLVMGVSRVVFFVLFLFLLVLGSLSLVSASNDHIVQGTTFDDINSTIRDADDTDRILLGNKIYTSNGNSIRVINKTGLLITGESDSQRAVLNANHISRIFIVDENSTVTFRFIDFINGNSSTGSGAAIRASNTIIVENCTFRSNYGESGAGIFLASGAVNSIINNSMFINNQGRYEGDDEHVEGGAVDTHSNHTTIINCYFERNSALTTGGAINFATTTTGHKLINSIFIDNYSPLGGAIRVSNSDAIIEGCTFTNNYANETSGGALYIRYSDVTVRNCNFTDNYANESGGALYIRNSDVIVEGCNFVDNYAYESGGAVYLLYSDIIVEGCNFTNNRAVSNGGAIYDIANSPSQYLNITNSRFNDNRAENGGAIYSESLLSIINSNFTSNRAGSGNTGGVYSTNTRLILGCIFTNNVGIAIRITGNNVIVRNNIFTSNSGHAIMSSNLQNAIINNNTIRNSGGTGIIINGNGNRIYNNTFTGNNIGVVVNGNGLNFTNNHVSSSRSDGLRLTGNNLIFVSNNITSNGGHGLVFNGINPTITNCNFWGNNFGINGLSLSNGIIRDNVFSANRGTAIYVKGNSNRILRNSFLNNRIGVSLEGNRNNISNNNFNANLAQGVYLIGNDNYVGFNSIRNNKRNAIYVRGSSVVIERNNITGNSFKGYSTIQISGGNAKVLNNNISSNWYRGLEITGKDATISNNIFRNNIDTQLWINGNNALIKSNSIIGGTGHGIYLSGNNGEINSNTLNSNGLDGVYAVGKRIQIKNNDITANKRRGVYLKGDNSELSSNTINKNFRSAVVGAGKSNIFNSNKITDNSRNNNFRAFYFEGNKNTFRNNNIVNNGFHGLHIIGSGNVISKNYFNKNNATNIIVRGNKNTISENRGYNGKNNGLQIHGSNNIISKNILDKNKNGIVIKGTSNQLNSNFVRSNLKHGVYNNGSKNNLIQNVIRSNNIGIYHVNGKSNKYNHNNIVNKKHNLYLKKGSVNAEYNWWGENKVAKVNNAKVNRHVIGKFIAPDTIKKKVNYSFSVAHVDDKNKKLKLSIHSLKHKLSFDNGYIKHKSLNISSNKASSKFGINKDGVYALVSKVDSQTLIKNYMLIYGSKAYALDSKDGFKKIMRSVVSYMDSQISKNSKTSVDVSGYLSGLNGKSSYGKGGTSSGKNSLEQAWDFLNKPLFKIPYYDQLNKIPGGNYLKELIDFVFCTDNGNFSIMSGIFIGLSLIPGGAVVGRAVRVGSKLAKYLPNLGKLAGKIVDSTLGKAIVANWKNIKKIPSYISKTLKILSDPVSIFKMIGKTPLKDIVIPILKNDPIGKYIVKSNNIKKAYNTILTITNPTNYVNAYNNVKNWATTTYNNGKKTISSFGNKAKNFTTSTTKKVVNEAKKFVKNPIGYTTGAIKNTWNFISRKR